MKNAKVMLNETKKRQRYIIIYWGRFDYYLTRKCCVVFSNRFQDNNGSRRNINSCWHNDVPHGISCFDKTKTELIPDERVTRINEKAGYYAGLLIMLAVIILFQADKIWSLDVELEDMYYTVLFVGMFSWMILRWYYNKREV